MKVVEFYKSNPNLMNNLRGIALEEKVMNGDLGVKTGKGFYEYKKD